MYGGSKSTWAECNSPGCIVSSGHQCYPRACDRLCGQGSGGNPNDWYYCEPRPPEECGNTCSGGTPYCIWGVTATQECEDCCLGGANCCDQTKFTTFSGNVYLDQNRNNDIAGDLCTGTGSSTNPVQVNIDNICPTCDDYSTNPVNCPYSLTTTKDTSGYTLYCTPPVGWLCGNTQTSSWSSALRTIHFWARPDVTCTITGPTSLTVGQAASYTGNCSGPGRGTTALYQRVAGGSWNNFSNGVGSITSSFTCTTPGTYDFVVNSNSGLSSGQCSGNPDCAYHGGSASCTGFIDCGPSDKLLVTCNPAPTPAPSPPTPPTLTGSPQCVPTRAALSWTAVSGATEYHIERCTGAGCASFVEIVLQPGTTLSDTSVVDNTTYNYRVRAHNHTAGLFSLYSNTVTISPSCFRLTASSACSPTRVDLSWVNPPAGSDDYHVQRCTGATCTFDVSSSIGQTTNLSYPDSTVANNTTYRYRIFGHSHSTNGITGYSTIATITPSCALPSPSPSPSPTPIGTIQARVVVDTMGTGSCSNIITAPATEEISGTSIQLNTVGSQVQGTGYVAWTSLASNLYTLIVPALAGYGTPTYCWRIWNSGNLPTPSSAYTPSNSPNSGPSTGSSQSLPTSGWLRWDIGYPQNAGAWPQVRGGNVHSNQSISINLPGSNYFLIPEQSTLYSGIVSFKDTATFTSAAATPTPINNGFLVDENAAHPKAVSYYTYFNSKLGNVTSSTISAKPDGNPDTCGASNVDGTCVYKTADLTIQTAPWNVASGERLVIFVSRQLTIGTAITVADGGFIAFIVADDPTVVDDILIRGTVGYPSPYADPSLVNPFTGANVSGLFITDGRLRTEYYSGLRQLVASGTFVANEFLFERSLGAGNNSNPGELFIYRPDLWRNAPEALKEIEINWQEVAP